MTSHIRPDVGQGSLKARRRLEELSFRAAGASSWAADGPDEHNGLGLSQDGTHFQQRRTHSRGQDGPLPRERHLRLVGKDDRKVVGWRA